MRQQHRKSNTVDSVSDVIRRYNEWHQSVNERQNRRLRSKIPYRYNWTPEAIEKFR